MEEKSSIYDEEILNGKRIVRRMQRNRLVRKGRKRKNAFRTFMCFVVNVGLIVGLIYLTQMPQWFLDKDLFSHAGGGSLEILNNEIVSTPKILSALRSEEVPEKPIYLADTKNVKEKLMQFPPIDEVYIRRYAFPARLQVIVREREPYIMISPDSKVQPVAFFTKDGKLIGREYLPLKKKYDTLLVLSYGNKGDDYSKWDLKKLQHLEKIVKYVENYSKEPVEYLDLRDPNDIYVKIKSVNIRLGRIDEHLSDRIERIPSLMPEIQLMDSKIKYLDLRWENANYLKLDK